MPMNILDHFMDKAKDKKDVKRIEKDTKTEEERICSKKDGKHFIQGKVFSCNGENECG